MRWKALKYITFDWFYDRICVTFNADLSNLQLNDDGSVFHLPALAENPTKNKIIYSGNLLKNIISFSYCFKFA